MNTSVKVYLRVSSDSQSHKMQEKALRDAFPDALEGAQWLKETGSGKKADRPVYAALKRAIKAGEVSKVYVYAWDRIARSITELYDFVQVAKKARVEVVSLKNPLDINGQFADLVLMILGFCAELERKMIRERCGNGLNAKTMNGGWRTGGSAAGWFAAKTIKKAPVVYALYDAGFSINAIAKQTRTEFDIIERLIAYKGKHLPTRKEVKGQVVYKAAPSPDCYLRKEDD